jgi:outer membrane protein assembly factor BamA
MVIVFKGKYFIKTITFLLLIPFMPFSVLAQSTSDTIKEYPIKSVADLFKKKDSIHIIKPLKDNFFLVIPIIGTQPSTGFAYGVVGQYTFKGKNIKDKFSSLNLGATFTEKKQMILNFKNSVMLKQNKYFLNGDWRYYVFSQSNYGLGTDIIPPSYRDEGFDLDDLEEPMDYNYFKLHQTVSMRIKNNYYAGAGVHLDWYSNIVDENLDIDNAVITHHFLYSKKYGYDPTQYAVNGISFNLLYDSRDSQINTNNGMYANINYRINPAIDKSNQNASNVLLLEYRYFLPLSLHNKQHVLSLWAYGQAVTSGNVPYLNLPSIGWDQRSRSGKGYTQGLFRGEKLMYLETEYRFPITSNQLISGTLFGNFTSTSDTDRHIKLFQYIQPAVGVGLRFLIDKETRTNLIFNYAVGRKSDAFYLNAGESF